MVDKCSKCGVVIQEFLTGRKKIDGQVYCEDCYFDELGTIVEKHPIGGPLLKPLIPQH